MSIVKSEDAKKWINAFIAICSILLGYVVINFMNFLGEYFDLEAKVNHYLWLSQGLGVALAIASFIFALKHKEIMTYLGEVYGELVKVVWPDKDSIVKLTVGIVIALAICSGILVLIDFIFRKILSLIY